jgi:protein TonB
MFDAMKSPRERKRGGGLRPFVWLVAGLMAAGGCAASSKPQTAAPSDLRPTPAPTQSQPATPPAAPSAAVPSWPGCAEAVHLPFPEDGRYVAIDELPEAITKVAPVFPAGAVEGTVMIQALVCEHGRVVKTSVVKSIPELDEAARTAVAQWTFRPARNAGQPVAVQVSVPVRFAPK